MNDAIVTAARGWLGTRFHHQGRRKKSDAHAGGVDCLGLLVGVADELALRSATGVPLTALDETDYAHLPDIQRLRQKLSEVLRPVTENDVQPGDVGLFEIDGRAQHLAIFGRIDNTLSLIHAYAPARCVVEHGFDENWRQKLVCAFCVVTE